MTTLEVLKGARERIARGWYQGAFAKTSKGRVIGPSCRNAACWCAIGSIEACDAPVLVAGNALSRLRAVIGHSIAWWQDQPGRTQAEVLAAFDRAIELEEQRT